jgi:Response regulator of the LytR/AlgR family
LILKLIKDPEQKETLVQVAFSERTMEVERIINKLQSEEITMTGIKDNRKYKITLADIYYIESVDKKTFLYCKEDVYQCQKRLCEILEDCIDTEFAQISKSCIINLNQLSNIKTLPNSRWEAVLLSGEKLLISRKFIPVIRRKIYDIWEDSDK